MAANKESLIRTIYEKVNSVLGNDNQLFVMEFPARGLNPNDFEYSTEHRTSIVTKPYSVMEREFRLTDDLFNVSRITGGPNGEKLSTVFDTIINNYVPSLNSYTKFAKDKVLLRRWLMEDKKFTDKDGKEIVSSRIAFCEKLMNAYLDGKLKWEEDKKAKFDELKKSAKVDGVEVPELLHAAMDEYARWLGSTGLVRDEKLNQLYNDVVVRGNLHEVMTFLGFLNASTTAEALESTKQFMRNSSRSSVDSSSKIYPVTLNPTNWFKALRPNFSPKDLTMSKEALAAQYRGKVKALADIKSQKAEFELMTVNEEDFKAAETAANNAQETARKAEQVFLKGQTEAILSAAKMAYQAARQAATGPLGAAALAANTVFKSRLSSLTDVVFDEKNLKEITEGITAVGEALDVALAAKEKFVSLNAKKAMLKSHNFKSQIQKLDAQIELLTSDIQYLEPLVAGAISIAEKEAKQVFSSDWKKGKTTQEEWVLMKMIEAHSTELSVLQAGVTKGPTETTITALDKTKLSKELKPKYEAFETQYTMLKEWGTQNWNPDRKLSDAWVLEKMIAKYDAQLKTLDAAKGVTKTADNITALDKTKLSAELQSAYEALEGVHTTLSADANWNAGNKDQTAWVLAKMIAKHETDLTAAAATGVTKTTVAPITALAKATLPAKFKQAYEAFEAQYTKQDELAKQGVVAKSILPDSDLDISDLSFTDIIISSDDTTKTSESMTKAQASSTSVSARGWFTNFKYDNSQSSAQSAFESAALSSKFECGFRVAKVTIDRGGWFNPTLLKMSSAFFRLADFIGGSGLTMQDIDADKFLDKAKNSLLPAFPIAFVIAKDITFKIEASEAVSKAANSNSEGSSSIGGGFGPFSASSASSNSSTSETAYSGVHGNSLYIRIPGPQILGWYMQFTAEDKSTPYMQQSNDQGTGAVDILTLDDEAILLELRLRREQLEDKMRSENSIF